MPRRITANLSRGRYTVLDELVPHLGADGDEHVRAAGEVPLDLPEERRPARPEVALEDVSVEGVDDDREAAHLQREAPQPVRSPRPSPCVCAGCAGARSGSARSCVEPTWRRAAPRPHVGAPGCSPPRLRAARRGSPSSPPRVRGCLRRASCGSRASRARRRGWRRGSPGRPCLAGR